MNSDKVVAALEKLQIAVIYIDSYRNLTLREAHFSDEVKKALVLLMEAVS